jgi:hypothetical protein
VDARLVEDDVRELREAVLDVLRAAAAHDMLAPRLIGAPERRLVDPVGFLENLLAEAERLVHLHAATRDAVRFSEDERLGRLLEQFNGDLGERGQLRRQGEPGGAAADDEDVDLPLGGLRRPRATFERRTDERITGLKAVEVKLHGPCVLCRGCAAFLVRRLPSRGVVLPLAFRARSNT